MLVGCVEEYNASLPASESQVLVVEGTIVSDSLCTFYLSQTMPINNTVEVPYIDDATIQLKGTDGTLVSGSHIEDGTYQIDVPKLNVAVQYSLVVNYNGDSYETDAQNPLSTTGLEKVEVIQESSASDVDIYVTTKRPDDASQTQYFRWTYNETWEVKPALNTCFYWDTETESVLDAGHLVYPERGWRNGTCADIIVLSSSNYSNNQISKYKLYGIGNADRRLFVRYSTEIVQRSLSKAEYEYETERKKISSDMGGLFTPLPSELPSNIHCTTGSKRAIGYVGCALDVVHYRLFINDGDVYVKKTSSSATTMSSADPDYPGENEIYGRGYRVYMYIPDMEITWALRSDLDLTLQSGVYFDKPIYWPN